MTRFTNLSKSHSKAVYRRHLLKRFHRNWITKKPLLMQFSKNHNIYRNNNDNIISIWNSGFPKNKNSTGTRWLKNGKRKGFAYITKNCILFNAFLCIPLIIWILIRSSLYPRGTTEKFKNGGHTLKKILTLRDHKNFKFLTFSRILACRILNGDDIRSTPTSLNINPFLCIIMVSGFSIWRTHITAFFSMLTWI